MTWSIVILGEKGLERSFCPSGQSNNKKKTERNTYKEVERERGSDTAMQQTERETERKY